MLTIQLTDEEFQTVKTERFSYPCPIVQKRLHVLYLKMKQKPHNEIAEILGIHPNSVTNYLKMYQAGGFERINQVNYGTNISQLEIHGSSLEKEFRLHPPLSTNEAIHRIEEFTGIRRSSTRVKAWINKRGQNKRGQSEIETISL